MDNVNKYRICMVSDFFYPLIGGVENHIYQLSQCLIEQNHKVIVVTHAYNDRVGVRYMANGLKVYYLPYRPFYNNTILPTVFSTIPLIRSILLREQITIVHGHSSFSTLAHETMHHAKTLGIRTVFTDHSLFGFADLSSVLTNKILQVSLVDCHHIICVSHTCKENTMLRANLKSSKISVIPNAVDSSAFTPDITLRPASDEIVIIVASRLVYRKGIDLLIGILPKILRKYSNVKFRIAGNGPKEIDIREVIEREGTEDRVALEGSVNHDKMRDFLNSGHIFLNTSLTEAFCMAIVEAAACGLLVVSTKVGGIPEVLPSEDTQSDIMILCEANINDVFIGLCNAIDRIKLGQIPNANQWHDKIKNWYSWRYVTQNTEVVYNHIMTKESISLKERIQRYKQCGFVSGFVMSFVAIIAYLIFLFLDYHQPKKLIDLSVDYMNLRKNHFELLANELIHEVLDYLSPIHIIKCFKNLNKRFSHLISQRLLKVDLTHLSKIQYNELIQILPLKQINSLKISNRWTINIVKHIPFKSMNNLQVLILAHISYNELRYLFEPKNLFLIFQQLNIFKIQSTNINGLDRERIFVLKKIFSQMPKLRLCQIPLIDVNDFDDLTPSFTLERLIIDYCTMMCLGK
ncbi:unnamed protein product [Adineta steineri]|uniref:phosphatidylinositol N-acetylglucosaminyltransferase n=1 Tax=Adineta steineri TaxID=433720 RepID=A0A813NF17_9BILA|nr:unnamed protein product [Adineta steineri]